MQGSSKEKPAEMEGQDGKKRRLKMMCAISEPWTVPWILPILNSNLSQIKDETLRPTSRAGNKGEKVNEYTVRHSVYGCPYSPYIG